jgi:excisionase family DNA binding protein
MDEYLTIFEVAGITKYTVATLRKFVLRREIPFHKWGRSLRFRRGELALWIKSGGTKVVYLPDDENGPELDGTMETGDGQAAELEGRTGDGGTATADVAAPPPLKD